MDKSKINNTNELKNFMIELRSGQTLKLLKSIEGNYQEKVQDLHQSLDQAKDQNVKQQLILQDNSYLIEKFQKQFEEVSAQYSKLLEKEQLLLEENQNKVLELQSSEEKFAQLDIAYDQQITSLSETIEKLKLELASLKEDQNKKNETFGVQAQLELKIQQSEEMRERLANQLKAVTEEKDIQCRHLKEDIHRLEKLNDNFQTKIKKQEEEIKHFQENISLKTHDNQYISELKEEIKNLKEHYEKEKFKHIVEKSELDCKNGEFKEENENLKRQLSSLRNNLEEAYLRHLPHSKSPASQSNTYRSRKRYNVDENSDSDNSTFSFCVQRRDSLISQESDKDSLFTKLRNQDDSVEKKQQISKNLSYDTKKLLVKRRRFSRTTFMEDTDVPESPEVSSSAVIHPVQQP